MQNLEALYFHGSIFPSRIEDVRDSQNVKHGLVIYGNHKLTLYRREGEHSYEEIIFQDSGTEKIVTNIQYLSVEDKLRFASEKFLYTYDFSKHLLTSYDISKYIYFSMNPSENSLVILTPEYQLIGLQPSIAFDNEFMVMGSCNITLQPVIVENLAAKKLKQSGDNSDEGVYIAKKVNICWRDDGEYFAMHYKENRRWHLKIYKYPPEEQYSLEGPMHLVDALCWRPVRNMITTHVKDNDGSKIIFHEMYGKKLFEYLLENNDKVIDMKWSSDGEILMLQQEAAGISYISLYLVKAGTWDLKQKLEFKVDKVISSKFISAEEQVYKLQVTLKRKSLEYGFVKTVSRNFNGVCAATSGKALKLYEFNKQITPPPLSNALIEYQNPVNMLLFGEPNMLCAVDSKNTIYCYEINNGIQKLKEISLPMKPSLPLSIKPLLWHNGFIYYRYINEDLVEEIRSINLLNNDNTVLNMDGDDNYVKCLIRRKNLSIVSGGYKASALKLYSSYVEHLVIDGKVFIVEQSVTNALTINNIQIASNITSVLIYANYLLVTSGHGKLYCLKLNKEDLSMICSKKDMSPYYFREIEPGAILISGIPGRCKIILQMPRGTFEIVKVDLSCKLHIEELLNQHKWKEAVNFIRLERMSCSLLFTLNPNRFFDNIDKFVQSINSVKLINSILLEMQEENASSVHHQSAGTASAIASTKQLICSALSNYLKGFDCATYISTLMICYYLTGHFNMVFRDIADLVRMNRIDLAIQAINTMLLYVEPMKLFKLVLRTYDAKIIEFVAKNLQLHPLQYEHILKRIKLADRMPHNKDEMLFIINDYLEQPQLAIYNLLFQDQVSWKRVREYMQKHNLYKHAYNYLFVSRQHDRNNEHYKMVASDYGEYLQRNNRYKEAATIFIKAGMPQQAFACYKLSSDWVNASYAASKFIRNPDEERVMTEALVMDMLNANRYRDAAEICLCRLHSFDRAMEILLHNDLVVDAVNMAKKFNNVTALISIIYPHVMRYCKKIEQFLIARSDNIDAYVNRLRYIRDQKAASLRVPEASGVMECSDVMSVTDTSRSGPSNQSNCTTASVKSKRKLELRKQDLRPNNIYLDIALIRAIHIQMTEVLNCEREVQTLCLLLIEASDENFTYARAFQKYTIDLHDKIKTYLPAVWPSYLYDDNNTENSALKMNFGEIDSRYAKPPELPNIDWNKILE